LTVIVKQVDNHDHLVAMFVDDWSAGGGAGRYQLPPGLHVDCRSDEGGARLLGHSAEAKGGTATELMEVGENFPKP